MTRFRAYTSEQAMRVTGVSVAALRRWDAESILLPEFDLVGSRGERHTLYSFQDLLAMQALAWLQSVPGSLLVPTTDIGKILKTQVQMHEEYLGLQRAGDVLVLAGPAGNIDMLALVGDVIIPDDMQHFDILARDTERRSAALNNRSPDQIGRIEPLAGERGRRPVLAGTRIPTIAIWEFHEAGFSVPEILEQYPRLATVDVESAITYEADRRDARRVS